jgi:hypothetical protein
LLEVVDSVAKGKGRIGNHEAVIELPTAKLPGGMTGTNGGL